MHSFVFWVTQTAAGRKAPLAGRMTEGVDVPQTPRTTLSNGSIIHQARVSVDASQSHETWSRSSFSHLSDMGPGQGHECRYEPENQDDQEVESSSLHEGLQCHTGVAGERHSGHLAPDGGWGWVVLTATILVLALTLAFPSCIGIFYTDLQKEFQASNSEISWVPAIMTAVLHAGGRKWIHINPYGWDLFSFLLLYVPVMTWSLMYDEVSEHNKLNGSVVFHTADFPALQWDPCPKSTWKKLL